MTSELLNPTAQEPGSRQVQPQRPDPDGDSDRTVAEELSLRWATATTTRATRSQAKPVPLGRRG
jgi:hypothetical protein